MLEVSSGKTDPGFFRGSSNSEVSHPNPRMAATPAATKSPRTSRHDLGQGNPDDQSKQPIRRAALSRSQSLNHLYPADLRADGWLGEAGQVFRGRLRSPEVIDQ